MLLIVLPFSQLLWSVSHLSLPPHPPCFAQFFCRPQTPPFLNLPCLGPLQGVEVTREMPGSCVGPPLTGMTVLPPGGGQAQDVKVPDEQLLGEGSRTMVDSTGSCCSIAPLPEKGWKGSGDKEEPLLLVTHSPFSRQGKYRHPAGSTHRKKVLFVSSPLLHRAQIRSEKKDKQHRNTEMCQTDNNVI